MEVEVPHIWDRVFNQSIKSYLSGPLQCHIHTEVYQDGNTRVVLSQWYDSNTPYIFEQFVPLANILVKQYNLNPVKTSWVLYLTANQQLPMNEAEIWLEQDLKEVRQLFSVSVAWSGNGYTNFRAKRLR